MPVNEYHFLSSVGFQYLLGIIVIVIGIILLAKNKKFNFLFRFFYNLIIGVDPGKQGENMK